MARSSEDGGSRRTVSPYEPEALDWLAGEMAREAAEEPYGDITYADPGYQADGVKRYPLDTEAHCRAAWSYINMPRNAAKYTPEQLKRIKSRIKAALKRYGVEVQEASMPDLDEWVDEDESTAASEADLFAWRDAVEELTREAAERYGVDADLLLDAASVSPERREVAESFFAELDHVAEADADDPALARAVEAAVAAFAPDGDGDDGGQAVESVDVRLAGRVMEAKGDDGNGGRVYRVRLIKYGRSRNGRRYSEAVMRRFAHKYEGAPAFDRHRTPAELQSSTTQGLIGQYRNVTAEPDGLYADLHLLPSATHAAEALDASLDAQAQGLPPLVGVSHDVRADFRPSRDGRGTECSAIVKVQSTDLVTDPAAGGVAVRALAGGTDPYEPETDSTEEENEEDEVTTESVLAALDQATDEQLSRFGLARAGTRATEAARPEPKNSTLAKLLIRTKLEEAGLTRAAEAVTAALPERITEADVDRVIATWKDLLAPGEARQARPTVTSHIAREAVDKKREALDAFFARDFTKGYRSFREAYVDFTGDAPRAFGEDFNRRVFRESFGGGFDSGVRATESADTSTWAQALGDSITRRMVDEYNNPSLQTWRQIVSDVTPVGDFRTQRRIRFGGYGTLPTVNEGQPYQPLTTPADEEATGALAKKGGTEDLTLETVANDDVGLITRIPRKLGRAAAQTLYRDVFDVLVDNDTCTYDSVALFHASHANTDTSAALSQTTLSTGRRKMIEQTAFGDSSEVLAITPKTLIVPPELEELGFQLTRSAVAVPSTPAGPSDTPNIHQANGLGLLLVPYLTDANDWFLVADPMDVPTLEVGFYQGRQEPELFTQQDNTVGSMFNADKITWKIRFIYYVLILEHRGFYRGQG